MSTAAPTNTPKPGGGYEVARPSGHCTVCHREIVPDEKLMTCLRETPTGMERVDVCLACWPNYEHTDVLAFWQTVRPHHEAKKKVFVDDEVLASLFERLADTTEPAKLNFRFVLGLILMRKRLVIYETSRQEEGRDIWVVRMKGREEKLDLVNPRLDEQQVLEVSQSLSEVLNQEL